MSRVRNAFDGEQEAHRRAFLKCAGRSGLALLALGAACDGDLTEPSAEATFNFQTDSGALNLAYAHAQLLADFYIRVNANKFVGITALEAATLVSIGAQKASQRAALLSLFRSRIGDSLTFNYSTIDFSRRESVMPLLQTFEDTGVAAINGSAALAREPANLLLLAKLVSSWARHAATIRDFNALAGGLPRTAFAGTVDAQGLDAAALPSAVVAVIDPYVVSTLHTAGR